MKERAAKLKRLKEEPFDILIIGGGATGAGIALDAALRGMATALIEKGDFASGTSSKSTKLIHGGVRYLEAAFTKGEFDQLSLVREALHERHVLLNIAPHLVKILPIVIPVHSWWQAAYYLSGMKIYEWMAGGYAVGKSEFISEKETAAGFPGLSSKNLKGGIQFFDCQFDDARMNLSIVLTAEGSGAAVSNYVEAVGIQHEMGKISSVQAKDRLTGEEFSIRPKVVVNAAGPLSDQVRKLDRSDREQALVGSLGSHLVINGRQTPSGKGLLIPKTSDGRVLFVLPWQGSSLVGTTDIPFPLTREPVPSKDEIEYLIRHLDVELGIRISKEEIRSCWAGIRPLAFLKGTKTSRLSRGYKIIREPTGLYSIIGGKWTSYRKMAEAVVDRICQSGEIAGTWNCKTEETPLVGAALWTPGQAHFLAGEYGLERDIAEHLSNSYGGKAEDVIKLARSGPCGFERVVSGFPYLMAEIPFAVRCEMACLVQDILLRRMRLAALDMKSALDALPKVAKAMQKEIGWSERFLQDQINSFQREIIFPINQEMPWSG